MYNMPANNTEIEKRLWDAVLALLDSTPKAGPTLWLLPDKYAP